MRTRFRSTAIARLTRYYHIETVHPERLQCVELNWLLRFVFRSKVQTIPSDLPNCGQEPILPAVLEFPETHQEAFLRQVVADLDVNAPNFKLAPVYTLYLCARYASSVAFVFIPSVNLNSLPGIERRRTIVPTCSPRNEPTS